MNKRIKKKQVLMQNKKLCKRYPFLIPRHRWTGKIMWDFPKWNWHYIKPYSFTELDAMPDGWRKAFGKQMCEEIRNALIESNYLNKYHISQIKEKYGSLRWYDFGAPEKVYDIIKKYTKLSQKICIYCGQPARIVNNSGWYEPICDKCFKEKNERLKKIIRSKENV